MSHNLTPKQRKGLSWVVENVRAGIIPERFSITWMLTGALIAHRTFDSLPDDGITKGNLDAWEHAKLVIVRPAGQYGVLCTLTQAAYDAIDSGFSKPDLEPNIGRLIAVLSDSFTLDELRNVASFLGIDYEEIGGSSKSTYTRELITYAKRRGLLWDLIRTAFTLD